MAADKKVDLQIRGVPADLRRRIGENAASKGVSMSKYVIELLEENVDLPGTLDAWLDEIAKSPSPPGYKPGEGTAAIRRIRNAIDRA